MQKRTKRILLAANFVLIAAFMTVFFLFVYFSYTQPLTDKLLTGKQLRFVLTFYGTENCFPDALECYYVLFERESGLLKILSVNTDAVVFRKKVKARSLKYSFFETQKKDQNLALTNFYQDVFEMTDSSFLPDFYVTASFESLLKLSEKNPELKTLIEKRKFAERDLECLNQLESAEAVLNYFRTGMFAAVRNIKRNYALLDTNISKLAFINMIMYFKMSDADILFFDLPAKYTKIRVEPDKENIAAMLQTVYYPVINKDNKTFEGMIEVKNASGKPRMAEKAAWTLRENKFDVLEWSNYKTPYEKTVIKDFKCDYGAALEIIKILGCGKIIVSYNAGISRCAAVFIGKDCEIYDKLDKVKEQN